MTRATIGMLLLQFAACGKSEKPAPVVVADTPRVHDAAVIIDASPFRHVRHGQRQGEVDEEQTFHKEHLDSGTHGNRATSMAVRTDK